MILFFNNFKERVSFISESGNPSVLLIFQANFERPVKANINDSTLLFIVQSPTIHSITTTGGETVAITESNIVNNVKSSNVDGTLRVYSNRTKGSVIAIKNNNFLLENNLIEGDVKSIKNDDAELRDNTITGNLKLVPGDVSCVEENNTVQGRFIGGC